MLKTIANRYAKRAAARRRAIRRRAASWKQRARRALTLMMVAGGMMGAGIAHAQMGGMGQGAMAPAGGLINRAVTRLGNLEANGPGWLYYGLNAADRGLGYNGSYMTLGGFIPYAEDDLGGLWSADLRSHISEYGGFFSNVGAVRKQFIGGTILGVGVYWDYDGDQNQYPLRGVACGTGPLGQFGHSYNQVGISAEWLTDYGNLRSNGYIPVGTTAYTAGAPGTPFYQNFVMCQHGLDAALSGADLEVGAYIPGLSDWAGMISVGGYALGNERYDWSLGPQAGRDVVPFFGGVYTRLDMTFVKNWDFSLQANNDSFFDWTGFARLTYRMGGSRRRNVPDQMEQPMMRNEHIVRAHQTPIVAINETTQEPWRVIHVNNAAPAGGNGTAESPYTTIAAGNAAATNPFDVVFVSKGNATYSQTTPFTPLAPQQFLIGDGAPFCLASCCGPINIASGTARPTISNPSGPSVILDDGLTTANFIVQGSRVGVQAGPGLLVGQTATVTNYQILGSNVPGQLQTGIALLDSAGTVNVSNTLVQNMTDGGIRVNGNTAGNDPPTNRSPNLTFQGTLTNTGTAGGGTSPIIEVKNTLGGGGGKISIAAGPTPAAYTQGACPDLLTTTVPNLVNDNGGGGIVVENSDSNVTVDNVTLANSVGTAVSVLGSGGSVKIGTNGPASITSPNGGSILVKDGATEFVYKGSIANTKGKSVNVDGITGGSVTVTNPAGRSTDTGDGIVVQNVNMPAAPAGGPVLIEKFDVASAQQGILVQNNKFDKTTSATFNDINVTKATTAGVQLTNNKGPININTVSVTLSATNANTAIGLLAVDNDTITMTGFNKVSVEGNAAVSVTNDPAIVDTTKLLFTTVSSSNSPTNGVLLSGVDGKFNADSITVTKSGGVGVLIQDTQTGLTMTVPSVTVAGGGGGGVSLVNVNQGSSDVVNLGVVSLQTTGGTGLLVQNSLGPAAGNGLVLIAGGSIAATNGPAIQAKNANLDVSLTTVSSTNSGGAGISIIDSDSTTGYPGLTIGTTTITSPAGFGIFLQGNPPTGGGAGVFAEFGLVSITNAGNAGIFAQNTNAQFSGATITGGASDAVSLFADAAETTTVLINGSTLSGAAGNGVRIQTAGGGTVNATVLSNKITVAGSSLNAVNAAGSTIGVNMAGNSGVATPAPGAGKIVMNNAAGGTFNVSQSSSVGPPVVTLGEAISAQNGSPGVDITTITGVLTEGQIIPTPYP